MTAIVLYRALSSASRGRALTTEQRLTLQALRAEARVEREVAKRRRIRAHLDAIRAMFDTSPEGRAA